MGKAEVLKQLKEIRDDEVEDIAHLPNRDEVLICLKEIEALILPDYFHYMDKDADELWFDLERRLPKQIRRSMRVHQDTRDAAELFDKITSRFAHIKRLVLTDIQAIYDGDPAAKSKQEVILCYPGFFAIFIYRIAHEFYLLNIPIIPRVMTEYVHAKTGIDINPGATIGEYFCIDHGTGVVIGETSIIGHHVKLYQGVTIGAKSFKMDENGLPVKGGKRHPNIGNNVVIYANATILGGDTTIEDNCIIGGNTWITSSVAAGEKVVNE